MDIVSLNGLNEWPAWPFILKELPKIMQVSLYTIYIRRDDHDKIEVSITSNLLEFTAGLWDLLPISGTIIIVAMSGES